MNHDSAAKATVQLNQVFDCIYVLSLKHAQERQHPMQHILKDVNFQLFSDVDKRDLDYACTVDQGINSSDLHLYLTKIKLFILSDHSKTSYIGYDRAQTLGQLGLEYWKRFPEWRSPRAAQSMIRQAKPKLGGLLGFGHHKKCPEPYSPKAAWTWIPPRKVSRLVPVHPAPDRQAS